MLTAEDRQDQLDRAKRSDEKQVRDPTLPPEIPACHHFIVGLEDAEVRAERERSIGWAIGVLDPGVDPGDYHWREAGDDVVVHCVENVGDKYLLRLVEVVLNAGVRSLLICGVDGAGLFAYLPEKLPEPPRMAA